MHAPYHPPSFPSVRQLDVCLYLQQGPGPSPCAIKSGQAPSSHSQDRGVRAGEDRARAVGSLHQSTSTLCTPAPCVPCRCGPTVLTATHGCPMYSPSRAHDKDGCACMCTCTALQAWGADGSQPAVQRVPDACRPGTVPSVRGGLHGALGAVLPGRGQPTRSRRRGTCTPTCQWGVLMMLSLLFTACCSYCAPLSRLWVGHVWGYTCSTDGQRK